MTSSGSNGFARLPYYPRHYYRDLPLPIDPHHAAALRARDLEIFTAHGAFCRRPIPNEFRPEVMSLLGGDAFVAVSFNADRWHRQLAAQRVTLPQPRRRVKR